MHRLVEQFGPEVKKTGILGEWSMYADQHLDVETLANVFMEYMRSTADAQRQAFVLLLVFMKTRPWLTFLEAITHLLEPEELERFKKPGADDIYYKLRLLCILQVEEYWQQFYASKQTEAKWILEGLDKIPSAVLEAKIQAVVKEEVEERMESALKEVVVFLKSELKKLFDERDQGEGWKTGGASKPD